MARTKKPAKILPDNLNMALRVAAAAELRPKNAGAFVLMPEEFKGLVEGIQSLVAERDAAQGKAGAEKRGKMKYLVALAVGGVMEHPEFDYQDFDIIEAPSGKAAVAAYNKKWKCDYFYGRVMRKLDDRTLSEAEREQLSRSVQAKP